MVCGSIGYGGIDDVRRFYTLLATEGFEIVDHIVGKEMDYSDIKDFRNKKELSHQIVNHDLEYVRKADVLIVLASPPSYGAAIEMFVAKNSGKKIILLAKDPVPTPWSINFSDYVVTTEEALIKLLWNLKKESR